MPADSASAHCCTVPFLAKGTRALHRRCSSFRNRPLVGLTTQTFDIVTRIAIGNGALVYRAVEKSTLRQVALKLLTQDGEVDHRLDIDALFDAVPRLKQITGAHVCQLLDAIRDEDGPVLVYEFANGINGSDFPHEKKLDHTQVLDVAAQLISSLRSGERQRTPHGELKPSNIVFMEAEEGRPYTFVLDWGLSAFRTETPDDSLQFFAPERLLGAPASHSADLFAAGAVLFYLSTGKLLVGGSRREQLIEAWQAVRPEVLSEMRPDLPSKFVHWVCSLLALDPAKRPTSAVEAGATLAALHPPPPQVPPESIRPRPAKRSGLMPPPSGIAAPAASGIRNPVSSTPTPKIRQPVRTETPPGTAGKKSSGLLIATLCVLVAAAIGGGAWWMLRDQSQEPDPTGAASAKPARTPPPSVTAPVPPIPQRPAASDEKPLAATESPSEAPAAPANNKKHQQNRVIPPGDRKDEAVFVAESFEYPAGSIIAGLSAGLGWAGPWKGKIGQTVEKSLPFPSHPAPGGSLVIPPSDQTQTLTRPIGPIEVFARNAKKADHWYVGFLVVPGDSTPAPQGELLLNPFDTSDPYKFARAIVEDTGPTIRITLNAPKSFLEIPDDGNPIYVVMRVMLSNPKAGKWDLKTELRVNPDFNATSWGNNPQTLSYDQKGIALPKEMGVLIRRKGSQAETRIDELRFGRHYEDMVFTPAPPPKK